MLELIRSAAVILALILSGNTDPVPVSAPDASGDPVPVVPAVPVLVTNQIV